MKTFNVLKTESGEYAVFDERKNEYVLKHKGYIPSDTGIDEDCVKTASHVLGQPCRVVPVIVLEEGEMPSSEAIRAFIEYDDDTEDHSEPAFRCVMDWLRRLAAVREGK